MQFTGQISAYIMPSRLDYLYKALKAGDHTEACNLLTLSASDLSIGTLPWPRVGTATVTVNMLDEDGIRQGIIDALYAERTNVQAEAHKRVAEIDEQIQNLLAITYGEPS